MHHNYKKTASTEPIRGFTMATAKRRAAFFTPRELEILMRSYGELEHVFRKKCNTAAAAKERETAWENIAARVNACNHAGEKRTWQQLKMKYKNIVQTANRKKAAHKTGGGPAPTPLTEAEELALNQNLGRPVTEGISGGSSSSEPAPQDTSALIKYSDHAICVVGPPHTTTDLVTDEDHKETVLAALTAGDPERPIEDEDHKETVFAAFIERGLERRIEDEDHKETVFAALTAGDPERLIEGMAGQQQEGPSASTKQIDTLPVKEIYKIHLLKKIQKTDKELQYLDRRIRREDLEIEILEHKLEEIKKTK